MLGPRPAPWAPPPETPAGPPEISVRRCDLGPAASAPGPALHTGPRPLRPWLRPVPRAPRRRAPGSLCTRGCLPIRRAAHCSVAAVVSVPAMTMSRTQATTLASVNRPSGSFPCRGGRGRAQLEAGSMEPPRSQPRAQENRRRQAPPTSRAHAASQTPGVSGEVTESRRRPAREWNGMAQGRPAPSPALSPRRGPKIPPSRGLLGGGRSRPHLALLDQGVQVAPLGPSRECAAPPRLQEGPQDGPHLLDLAQNRPVQLEEGPEPRVEVEELGVGRAEL